MTERYQKPPKRVYLATTIVVFFCMLSAADSIGFVPYYIDGSSPAGESFAEEVLISDLPELGPSIGSEQVSEPPVVGEVEPTRIQISAIDLDLPVQNPSTRDIAALDALLQKGPARYVDSSKLGVTGNMIIFAHSSHLPVVHNQMYRAFNKIPDLKVGDTITVQGADAVSYLYSVTSVRQTDSSDTIPLSATNKKLTLVTCDTLTGKSARYVLEAEFIGTAQ